MKYWYIRRKQRGPAVQIQLSDAASQNVDRLQCIGSSQPLKASSFRAAIELLKPGDVIGISSVFLISDNHRLIREGLDLCHTKGIGLIIKDLEYEDLPGGSNVQFNILSRYAELLYQKRKTYTAAPAGKKRSPGRPKITLDTVPPEIKAEIIRCAEGKCTAIAALRRIDMLGSHLSRAVFFRLRDEYLRSAETASRQDDN